jgi:hypothetical protein
MHAVLEEKAKPKIMAQAKRKTDICCNIYHPKYRSLQQVQSAGACTEDIFDISGFFSSQYHFLDLPKSKRQRTQTICLPFLMILTTLLLRSSAP